MAVELTVITLAHDLLVWTLNHTAKFPRSHRHGLGMRLEEVNHLLLDLLVEAKFTTDKAEILRQASLAAERLRWQFRAAKDVNVLPYKSHEFASRQLQEIGKQLGGWRRSTEGRK